MCEEKPPFQWFRRIGDGRSRATVNGTPAGILAAECVHTGVLQRSICLRAGLAVVSTEECASPSVWTSGSDVVVTVEDRVSEIPPLGTGVTYKAVFWKVTHGVEC